jgi:hypothetical protein
MQNILNAISILRQKLAFLIKVTESSPEVRANQEFIRRLNQIANQIHITSKGNFDEQMILQEYSDAQALTMLASITKSQGTL